MKIKKKVNLALCFLLLLIISTYCLPFYSSSSFSCVRSYIITIVPPRSSSPVTLFHSLCLLLLVKPLILVLQVLVNVALFLVFIFGISSSFRNNRKEDEHLTRNGEKVEIWKRKQQCTKDDARDEEKKRMQCVRGRRGKPLEKSGVVGRIVRGTRGEPDCIHC